MKLQELIDLGIEKELADKVFALHGKDITKLQSDVTDLKATVKTTEEALETANAKITEFGDMDIEAVKKESSGWKTKAEEAEKAREVEVAKVKLDFAVRDDLKNTYGAKDAAEVLPFIDLSTVKFDKDGKALLGLKEQAEQIQTSRGHLFNSGVDKTKDPRFVAGGGGGENSSVSALLAKAREGAELKPADK